MKMITPKDPHRAMHIDNNNTPLRVLFILENPPTPLYSRPLILFIRLDTIYLVLLYRCFV